MARDGLAFRLSAKVGGHRDVVHSYQALHCSDYWQ
jgi:hypothetical protein